MRRRRTRTQYFEMFGERGHLPRRLDGRDVALPRALERHGPGAEGRGQRRQVGTLRPHARTGRRTTTSPPSNPEKLKELQDLFWVEAAKYQVLPLDASALTRFVAPRPSIVAGRTEFTYTRPIIGIPLGTAPSILNKSFSVTAEIEVPDGGGEGMLVTQGGRFGGWGLYLLKGKPVFVYNLLDLERPRIAAPQPALRGQAHRRVRLHLRRPRPRQGRHRSDQGGRHGGGERQAAAHAALLLEASETFDIGSDTGTGVNDADYRAPFPFTGKLESLTLRLGSHP